VRAANRAAAERRVSRVIWILRQGDKQDIVGQVLRAST
jgi:hypothetical protein